MMGRDTKSKEGGGKGGRSRKEGVQHKKSEKGKRKKKKQERKGRKRETRRKNSHGIERMRDSQVAQRPTANAGDTGDRDVSLIPGSGRSPGEENGNPLQYSCLENPREAWQTSVHVAAKGRTRLSD